MVVADANENRGIRDHQPGQLQVLVNARRCADRACDSCPECLVRSWRPQQPSARLTFPSGENVVLKLRSQCHPEFILKNRNLILHKCAVNVVRLMLRQEVHSFHGPDNIAGTPSCSESPDDLISLYDEVMDGINIKSVASLSQLEPQSIGSIVVSLDLEIGRVTQYMVPASEQI